MRLLTTLTDTYLSSFPFAAAGAGGRRCRARVATASLLLLLPGGALAVAAAPQLALTEAGLQIVTPALTRPAVLGWPSLRAGGTEKKPVSVEIADPLRATVGYGAARAAVDLKEGHLHFHFKDLPADVKGLSLRFRIPAGEAGRLLWSYDASAAAAIPAEAGQDPFVCKGTARRFALSDAAGDGFGVHIPHGWQQFMDLRVWKTAGFEWMTSTEIPRGAPGEAHYTLVITTPDAKPTAVTKPVAATPKPPPAAKKGVEPGIRLGEQGIRVAHSAMVSYGLGYPKIQAQGKAAQGPHEVSVAAGGQRADVRYLSGASCRVERGEEGTLSLRFADLPAGPCTARMEMQVSYDHVRGGRFGTTTNALRGFPAEKQASPHLYQGGAREFHLLHPFGAHLALTLPSGSYQELTDCRHWNDWHMFKWSMQTPIGAGVLNLTVANLGQAAAAVPQVLVDAFGQSTATNWPGKVHSEDELKADVESEKGYYASFRTLDLDRYGGLAGSGAGLGLVSNGFFRMQQAAGRWYLVDPAGNAFFHLGICSFGVNTHTYVEGRREVYAWLPPTGGASETAWSQNSYWHDSSFSFHLANQIRKYGQPIDLDTYAKRMIARVRSFGFNSSGAFSGTPTQGQREAAFPYVDSIGGSEIEGLQRVWDPFDEQTRQKIEASMARREATTAKDPLLIGYMLANEPLFEDVPRVIPMLKGKVAAKRALVDQLRRQYATIEDFNAAWKLSVPSLDSLADTPLPARTAAAAADMDRYLELFLETFFRFSHDTIRAHDPNHLIIGARLQPGTASNEKVCRIAGKYVDVFSLNYYTYGIDTNYLGRIQSWCGGRPMMFTEFFFDAPADSGMGGGFKEVASQAHRGMAYRHYVEHAAVLPYVVGIQWYVLVDNPVTGLWYGRYGGLRDNNGMFSVADRPWKPLVEAMAETNLRIYDLMAGKAAPCVFDDPRFTGRSGRTRRSLAIGRCTGPVTVDGSAAGYPGLPPEQVPSSRLVQGKDAEGLEAVFRTCWDGEALHVLAEVTDPTPMQNSRTGADLWMGDAIELFVGSEDPDQPGALLFTDRHIVIGAGQLNGRPQWHFDQSADQPEIPVVVIRRPGGDGYTLETAIPFRLLGFEPSENRALLLDLAVDDSRDGKARRCQLMWNGGAGNSRNRSDWGRARLLP